mgnify:CR=1 FL=1
MRKNNPKLLGQTQTRPKKNRDAQKHLEEKEWSGNPLQSPVRIDYKCYENGSVVTDSDEAVAVEDDWDWERAQFVPSDIKKIDSHNGKFVFINANNESVVLTKVKEKSYNYYNAF